MLISLYLTAIKGIHIYIYLFRSKNCVAEYIRLHLKRYICLHYRNADLFLTAEAVKLIHLKLILKKLCENVYVFWNIFKMSIKYIIYSLFKITFFTVDMFSIEWSIILQHVLNLLCPKQNYGWKLAGFMSGWP